MFGKKEKEKRKKVVSETNTAIKGLDSAIKDKLQVIADRENKARGWNRTDDLLPAPGKPVMVFILDEDNSNVLTPKRYMDIAYWYSFNNTIVWQKQNWSKTYAAGQITHWGLLPIPPEVFDEN